MLSYNQEFTDIEELTSELKTDKSRNFIIIQTFDLTYLNQVLVDKFKDEPSNFIIRCNDTEVNFEVDIKIIEILIQKYKSENLNGKKKGIFLVRTDLLINDINVSPTEENISYVNIIFKRLWNNNIHLEKLQKHFNVIKVRSNRQIPSMNALKSFYFINMTSWQDNMLNHQIILENFQYLLRNSKLNEKIKRQIVDLWDNENNINLLKLRICMETIILMYPPFNSFINKCKQKISENRKLSTTEREVLKKEMTSGQNYELYIFSKYRQIIDACNMNAHGKGASISKLNNDLIILEFLAVMRFIICDLKSS